MLLGYLSLGENILMWLFRVSLILSKWTTRGADKVTDSVS